MMDIRIPDVTIVGLEARAALMIRDAAAALSADGHDVQLFRAGDVRAYGATGDGATDDGPAFQAALNAVALYGLPLYLPPPPVSYRINTTVNVPSNVMVFGDGYSSVITTTANAPVFQLTNVSRTHLRDFRVVGDGNAAHSLQSAICNGTAGGASSGDGRCRVDNLIIENMGGSGIRGYNYDTIASDVTPPFQPVGMQVRGLRATGCQAYAVYLGAYAEYTAITNPCLYANQNGIYIAAGNALVSGGEIGSSVVAGVEIAPSTNDAHGTVIGCHINHCNNPVYVHGTTLGFDFIGCHVYKGFIYLGDKASAAGAIGTSFKHCAIDADAFYFDGATGSVFHGCKLPHANANAIHNSYNAHASTTRWLECYDLTGNTPAFVTAGADGTVWS